MLEFNKLGQTSASREIALGHWFESMLGVGILPAKFAESLQRLAMKSIRIDIWLPSMDSNHD
jgi:hypothetical protein